MADPVAPITVSTVTVTWLAHTHAAGTFNSNGYICSQCLLTMTFTDASLNVFTHTSSISSSSPVAPAAITSADIAIQQTLTNQANALATSLGSVLTPTQFAALVTVTNSLNQVTSR